MLRSASPARRNYVGLANSSHDPAVAIVDAEGRAVFAEDCERYLQNKRAWGATADDFHRSEKLIAEYCENGADLVVSTTWRDRTLFLSRAQIRLLNPALRRLALALYGHKMSGREKWWLDHQMLASRFMNAGTNWYTGSNLAFHNHVRVLYETRRTIKRSYYHHLTHAAAACYTSNFTEAACLIIDGYGEDTSTAYYHYRDGRLTPIPVKRSSKAASLGYFYAAICWACGFDPWAGEEWKVMGLAGYGKFDERIYETLKKSVRVDNGRLVKTQYGFWNPELAELRRDPSRSPLESADLAFTAQQFFCEMVFEMVRYLHDRTGLDDLVIGGGCALNSACNGRILENSMFKRLHVYAAPGDDGNALGAAWLAFFEDHPEKRSAYRRKDVHTPYLGTSISKRSLESFDEHSHLKRTEITGPAFYKAVAQLIADGKIVGWVQGRAEFGPRALGNRSILADPRRPSIKERMNAQVKYREEFRPFAPSILHEHGPMYFEKYQETPYMERALVFREEARAKVPGVVHVDNTGRLQTVKREWNERYYDLISAFHELTGIPIVLNTSFNLMGKPIIHTLEDAVSVYLTCGMDALVVGDRIYQKNG